MYSLRNRIVLGNHADVQSKSLNDVPLASDNVVTVAQLLGKPRHQQVKQMHGTPTNQRWVGLPHCTFFISRWFFPCQAISRAAEQEPIELLPVAR